MEQVIAVPEMQSTHSPVTIGSPIIRYEDWTVYDLKLDPEKLNAIWGMLKRFRTLFSDLTKGDPDNFVESVISSNSIWFEVRYHDVLIGLIYFNDLHQITDCTAHMAFFDRAPAEKAPICKILVRWMFENFPLHRISVTPPVIYHATIRLLERIGFTREGTKREQALLGGKWVNQAIYGITRPEAEML